MRQEKPKSTPVDINKPENPVELLVSSANYLVRQVNAWSAIARDGAECRAAETQTVLMAELDKGLGTYRDRGLQALVHIVNDVVDQHNVMVARLDAMAARLKELEPPSEGKEASNGMGKEDAHAGGGEGDVRREDQGVPPVGAGEAEVQGDADRGGAEEAPQGELRPEGEERLREGEGDEMRVDVAEKAWSLMSSLSHAKSIVQQYEEAEASGFLQHIPRDQYMLTKKAVEEIPGRIAAL